MNIEISKETEALVAAAMETGHFESVEAFLATVTSEFLRQSARADLETPTDSDGPTSESDDRREQSWKEFRKPIDLEALAKEQGVEPITDPSSLKFEEWPEEDTVEDFIRRAKGIDEPVGPGGC